MSVVPWHHRQHLVFRWRLVCGAEGCWCCKEVGPSEKRRRSRAPTVPPGSGLTAARRRVAPERRPAPGPLPPGLPQGLAAHAHRRSCCAVGAGRTFAARLQARCGGGRLTELDSLAPQRNP